MAKTFSLFLLFISIVFTTTGQEKHYVKTNLVAPFSQVYSLQYEYKPTRHLGFNHTFFLRPKSLLPFGKQLDAFTTEHGVGLTGIKFENVLIDEAKVGVKGYSPELRFYLGKSKNPAFVGLFGMYEDFDLKVPANMLLMKEGYLLEVIMPVNFRFQALSGGILVGKRFNWNRCGLDVVIIGPHLGTVSNFKGFSANSNIKNLDENERDFLENNLKERFGLNEKYFSLKVSEEAANIKALKAIPYISLRGLGFNFWISF